MVIAKIYLEIFWNYCGQCGVSSVSDGPLFWFILVLKVYSCPSNEVSSIKCRVLICCTCHFQSSSPFFVYFGFLCLEISSMSNFHSDTWSEGGHLLKLTCSVVLWGREGHCKQILLLCVGSAHCGWTTLGLPQPRVVCTSWVCTAQAPGCSAGDVCYVGLAYCALPRSKLLRFSGALQGHRPRLAVHFVPFAGLGSSGDWVLGE